MAAPWSSPLLSSLLPLFSSTHTPNRCPSHSSPCSLRPRVQPLQARPPSYLIHQDYLSVPSPKKPALTPQFELGALCSPYTAVVFVNSGNLRPRWLLVRQASRFQPAPSQVGTTERLHSSAVVSENERGPLALLSPHSPRFGLAWPGATRALPMWPGTSADWG